MPDYAPVARAPRLSDIVADRLLQIIVDNKMSAGDPLPSERELGERFGVSRTVIREATRSLAAKGIIESRTGSGLRVAPLGSEAVQESMLQYLRAGQLGADKIFEIRRVLEIECAGLAAERITPEGAESLKASVEAMSSALKEDRDAFARADVEWHRQVARLTGNELFVVLLDSIRDVLLDIRLSTTHVAGQAEIGIDAHRLITEHIVAGDVAGARSTMKTHIEESLQAFLDIATEDNRWRP